MWHQTFQKQVSASPCHGSRPHHRADVLFQYSAQPLIYSFTNCSVFTIRSVLSFSSKIKRKCDISVVQCHLRDIFVYALAMFNSAK
jgi:hypothetical protein